MQYLREAKYSMLRLHKYHKLILDELDELNEDQLTLLDQIQLNKREVEKAYNKNVRLKQLSEGDIL